MTDQRLRDLLEERVADLTTTDLAGPAWAAGRAVRRRRRRGYAVGALAAAMVLAAVAGPAMLRSADDGGAPLAGRPGATGETYAGYPVTIAPAVVDEAALPIAASSLPARMDVRERASRRVGAGAALVAVGSVRADGTLAAVRVLKGDGWHRVDTSGLVPYDGRAPLVESMLSPDGRWVVFPQPGAVDLYDVVTGTWNTQTVTSSYDPLSVQWRGEALYSVDLNGSQGPTLTTFTVPGNGRSDLGVTLRDVRPPDGATPYGPVVANGEVAFPPSVSRGDVRAQAVSGLDDGTGVASAAKILVRPDDVSRSRWLVLDADRGPMPCPVVGWLDADTVVYLSRGPVPRLVSWRVGTDDFGLVTEIRGLDGAESRVGFADLDQP